MGRPKGFEIIFFNSMIMLFFFLSMFLITGCLGGDRAADSIKNTMTEIASYTSNVD